MLLLPIRAGLTIRHGNLVRTSAVLFRNALHVESNNDLRWVGLT